MDTTTRESTLSDFRVGQRVQLHPGTDRWMMGDRYGEIVRVDRTRGSEGQVQILLDTSCKRIWFLPRDVLRGIR
jgi:hypothetical protein